MTEAEHPAIRGLNALNPGAVALAELVSFAVLVDSQLLRQARLALTLPGVDAGAEADVWLSSLVQSRSPEGILFFPHAAKALRKRLANKPERLALAQNITRSRHERLVPAVAVEEEINCLSVNPDDQAFAHIERLLQSAAATLLTDETRSGLAHWAARVWPRLPAAVRQMEPARVLAMAAYLRLGEQRPAEEAEIAQAPESAGSQMPDWMAWALPKDLPHDSIGIKLVSNGIEFGPPKEGDHVIELPATTPLLIEVSWTQDASPYFRQVHMRAGERRIVETPPGEIRLRTISGERYVIIPTLTTDSDRSTKIMTSYNLFIASSGAARNVAAELWPLLVNAAQTKNLELRVERWWEAGFTPGVSTLQNLMEQGSSADFALFLLAEDDIGEKKGEEALIQRGNWLFEAGFFLGAFGSDPERLFLLTSCEDKDLPTDLLGLVKIKIPRLPAGALSESHVREVSIVASRVVNAILKAQPKPRGIIPLVRGAELIDWERLEENGGRLKKNSQVIISAEQPAEFDDPDFAKRIHQNMNGGVRYLYFFHADSSAANLIAEFVWSLATAGTGGGREVNEGDKEKIIINLRLLSKYLTIYLLGRRAPLQMCIHNAERANDASCYLRYNKEVGLHFIQWSTGAEAKGYADSLRRSSRDLDKTGRVDSIFRATTEFDFREDPEYKPALWAELQRLFPETLWDSVAKYCFGSTERP